MNLPAHLRILFRMVTTAITASGHAERLEQFYAPQADTYDEFRSHLLHGREDLLGLLTVPEQAYLVDMGGGTGSNIELLGDLERFRRVEIVDLCPSLLQQARLRIRRHGWPNVQAVEADATTYQPPDAPVDAVLFSYSLCMIPDWFRAVDRAWSILKPGGQIGVVGYTVSRKWPAPGLQRHSAFARWFWPWLFGFGNVFPSGDHLPYLQTRFQTLHLEERLGRMPYVPWCVPYYLFVGQK